MISVSASRGRLKYSVSTVVILAVAVVLFRDKEYIQTDGVTPLQPGSQGRPEQHWQVLVRGVDISTPMKVSA